MQMADAMVNCGMKDSGYEYIVIDDCLCLFLFKINFDPKLVHFDLTFFDGKNDQ